MKLGTYRTEPFGGGEINAGDFFILNGQTVFVAHIGEKTKNRNGTFNARMRVILDNRTESDLINRSLERALYKDKKRAAYCGNYARLEFKSGFRQQRGRR